MHKIDEIMNKLNFCGCGDPDDTLNTMKYILNVIDKDKSCSYDMRNDKIAKYLGAKNMNDHLNGLFQILLYHLDHLDILEHGVSIRGAWLTDEGKEFLKDLNNLTEADYGE